MDGSGFLIIGANGQLGKALHVKYPKAQAVDIDELDITDTEAMNRYDWTNITTILNAAAYTNVDGAETAEGRLAAWKVNAEAVANLVKVATRNDLVMVHVSSDYVFDGTKGPHTEDEPLSPLSVYGASKAAGDLLVKSLPKHYIVRTSWLIGDGKNFVRTMLELGAKGTAPTVVADQIGRLTFTPQLVAAIDHLLGGHADYGIYNVSNDGQPASWADITRHIFRLAGYKLKVTDTTTTKYFAGKDNVAPRPLNSVLDLSKVKVTGLKLTDWRDDLRNYVSHEPQNELQK